MSNKKKPAPAKKETLGVYLRRLRKERGWSQAEVGVRLATVLHTDTVADATICRYEAGNRMPHFRTLRGLETLFELTDFELIRYLG